MTGPVPLSARCCAALLAASVALGGFAAGVAAAVPPRTTVDAPSAQSPDEATAVRQQRPSALVGMWRFSGKGVQSGAVLRIDAREMTLFTRCGGMYGVWAARLSGAFLADFSDGDGGCFPSKAAGDAMAVLYDATAFRSKGVSRQLLDKNGRTIGTLTPGGHVKRTKHRSLRPLVVSAADRAELDKAPRPLPARLTPVSRKRLVGRWMPAGTTGHRAYLQFNAIGGWSGSDGCNGVGGRWSMASAGAILTAAAGANGLVGCSDHVGVEWWVEQAVQAALDGDTLVLIDRAGIETGRLTRDSADRQGTP